MTQKRTVLVGIHDADLAHSIGDCLEGVGYIADVVTTPAEMITSVHKKTYACYLMDLNLGCPGQSNISSAETVYELVRQQIESGDARFLGISGRKEIVQAALDKGIPSKFKDFDLDSLIDWLR